MLRLAFLLVANLAIAAAAWGQDSQKKTVILSDPRQGLTVGKVDGETMVLQTTPTGTVGRIGKDKVLLHKDGNGNTMGKVGKKKLFCHSDPATGLTLCK